MSARFGSTYNKSRQKDTLLALKPEGSGFKFCFGLGAFLMSLFSYLGKKVKNASLGENAYQM